MKKLRLGLVGPGHIAHGVHLPFFRDHPDVELAAVCSRSRERAEEAAAAFGIEETYTDYAEMLRSGRLDAVSVCVPNRLHAERTIQALEAGCHVLCEKPPAVTAEEAARMAAAAEKAGKVLAFNLQFRHSEQTKAVRSQIEDGKLGSVYTARVYALRRRGIPDWGVFIDKAMQGGGPLMDIGVHMLDTALYLMDYPEPQTVFAVMHRRIGNQPKAAETGGWKPEEFTIEDFASGLIRFRNGQSLIIESSFALNMDKEDEMSVSLFGDRAGASVFPPVLFEEKDGEFKNTPLPRSEKQSMHDRSLSDFIDSCLGRKTPLIHPAEMIRLQQILEALYRSAETGDAVSVIRV